MPQRGVGVISDLCDRHVERARDEAVALIEQRDGPFAEAWPHWRADARWQHPELPGDALDLPLRRVTS